MLATCRLHAGYLPSPRWLLAVSMLASCCLHAGWLLALLRLRTVSASRLHAGCWLALCTCGLQIKAEMHPNGLRMCGLQVSPEMLAKGTLHLWHAGQS